MFGLQYCKTPSNRPGYLPFLIESVRVQCAYCYTLKRQYCGRDLRSIFQPAPCRLLKCNTPSYKSVHSSLAVRADLFRGCSDPLVHRPSNGKTKDGLNITLHMRFTLPKAHKKKIPHRNPNMRIQHCQRTRQPPNYNVVILNCTSGSPEAKICVSPRRRPRCSLRKETPGRLNRGALVSS